MFVFVLRISTMHEVSVHAAEWSVPTRVRRQLAASSVFRSALTAVRLLPWGETYTCSIEVDGKSHLVTMQNARTATDDTLDELVYVLIQP
ncbi:hypothetical protein [Plantibacter sp. RU18]|uniref:hypothetical protein n=1 Tax=Plantibacter sp. RU18 TaxID=3158143 RepID=UPI003D35BA8E